MTKIIHYYFVDESGDLTLFNKRGVSIVGREGVSRFFMVGVASLPDPELAKRRLRELRLKLLNDDYFKSAPSMQPETRKTALVFHAKNDLPEVRREVFSLIKSLHVKVQAVVRRKDTLVDHARFLEGWGKLSDGEIYSSMVSRLFKNILHKADENKIIFSHRQSWTRAEALKNAIKKAKKNFEKTHGIDSDKPTSIHSALPPEFAGLQIVDYYLWALQRLYERGEARFFDYLKNDYRLIMDIDDKRNNPYGEWYSDSNPISLEKIKSPQTD